MSGKLLDQSVTRRRFIEGASAVTVAQSLALRALAWGRGRTLAYVGTYTGAVGGGSNGEGIYRFVMNDTTGELLHGSLVAKTPNPSWITIHPSKMYLYAVNEVSDYQGNSGSVSAFAIDPHSGDLTALNVVSSEGAGPCYLSIDAQGKFAFVANYGGGTTAVLPILDGGLLGAATDVHRDSGDVGATKAANAPPGSYAVSGHDAPHAHMILPDPNGKFVLATDLGQDRIYAYRRNSATGQLSVSQVTNSALLPTGNGPRHFVFHPNGRWLYSIQEESSDIAFFHYDAATGSLTVQETVSTLPLEFADTSFASEILIAADGRFLYAANRLHDTIATFAIGPKGNLDPLGEASTMGDYPGQCRIDPTGKFLYACNRRSDSITCFKIFRETGLLTFTGQYTAVGSPASITFLS